MRRAGALWIVLFAAYAATLGLDAFESSDYGGDEPHYLLAAESLVDDGDFDLKDEYAERSYASFYPYELAPHGSEIDGRLHETHGIGFPLLIAPAYAIAGPVGVELFLAALAALAVALAYLLALRAVPDPWALGAAAAVGLSPPFLAYGTAVYPALAAGAALAGAALLALRLEERVSRKAAFGCFLALGALPWLDPKFIPAGIVVGVFAVRALLGARRRTLALGASEAAAFSAALYIAFNEALYNGPTPYSAGQTATGADSAGDYLERTDRLATLFIHPDHGLLRWAPLFALAFVGLWILYRSRRDHLAHAAPRVQEMERVAVLCAAALGAQLMVAVFLAPTMSGPWFPPRHLLAALPLAIPLVALGLRRLPRPGIALIALTLGASAWLYLDVLLGAGALAGP